MSVTSLPYQSIFLKLLFILLLSFFTSQNLFAYTQCIDVDGNGLGTFESNGELCRINPRFDIQVRLNLLNDLNAFDQIAYQVIQPECLTVGDYTFDTGCFHRAYSDNAEYNEFAIKNNISTTALLTKFYPAGNNDNPWDKLVVIVGPFNSTGFMTVDQEVQWLLSQSQGTHLHTLLSYFHVEGFSVLYVASNHPSTNLLPARDKSRALAHILQKVRIIRSTEKTSAQEPVKIMGLSLGGVLSRLALVSMENSQRIHDVDLYFSVDAPHKGAHIPASIQYLATFLENSFRYASNKTEVSGLFNFAFPFSSLFNLIFKGLVTDGAQAFSQAYNAASLARFQSLGSVPTKELLAFHIDHADTSFFSPEYLRFLNLGFSLPARTKANIAVTNASITGQTNNAPKQYMSIITTEKKSTRLSFTTRADTPGATIFEGKLSFPNRNTLFLSDREYFEKITLGNNHRSHDSVPCSTTDNVVDTISDELDGVIQNFWPSSVEIHHNETCFVPLGSSIFSSVNFANSNPEMSDLSRSPFDEIIGTSRNTPHLSFELQIVNGIIDQFKRHRPQSQEVITHVPVGLLVENTVYKIGGRHMTYRFENSCIHPNSEVPVESNNNLDRIGELASPVRFQALKEELNLAYKFKREGDCLTTTPVTDSSNNTNFDPLAGRRPAPTDIQLNAKEFGLILRGETYYLKGVNVVVGEPVTDSEFISFDDPLRISCLLNNNDQPVTAINDLDLQGPEDSRYKGVKNILDQIYSRNFGRYCSNQR